jgi:alanine racemase
VAPSVRSTVAHVDLDAIASNLHAIRALLEAESQAIPPGRPVPEVIAVVKANAYGHGAVAVARTLEAAGASMLACADIEEGVALRQGGVRSRILVFGALSVSDLRGIVDHDLVPTVSTPTAARAVAAEAARRGTRIAYHLKIDTGMHRLGFRHDNLRRTLPDLLASPHLRLAAVYTHLATADDPEHPLFEEQRARFQAALATLDALGAPRVPRHAANSAALLRDSRTWYDAVRPGLLLYGVVPPPLTTTMPLCARHVDPQSSRRNQAGADR